MLTRKDWVLILIIGAAVGLLIQPVLTNTDAVGYLHSFLPVPSGLIRPIIFLAFLLLAPTALAVAALIGRTIPLVLQFAKFAAVGSLNSFIDLGVFNVMSLLWGQPAEVLRASLMFPIFKSISFFAATTNSFFWNKAWTFGDRAKADAGQVIKFYAITGFNWLLNVGVATAVAKLTPMGTSLDVWVNVVGPVAGFFAGMIGNFLGYKFVVFKSAEPSPPPPTASI